MQNIKFTLLALTSAETVLKILSFRYVLMVRVCKHEKRVNTGHYSNDIVCKQGVHLTYSGLNIITLHMSNGNITCMSTLMHD